MATSFSPTSDIYHVNSPHRTSGFCIIDLENDPPGIASLLKERGSNINYAIPRHFDNLEVYIVSSGILDASIPVR
jgi:hypothetical protein